MCVEVNGGDGFLQAFTAVEEGVSAASSDAAVTFSCSVAASFSTTLVSSCSATCVQHQYRNHNIGL